MSWTNDRTLSFLPACTLLSDCSISSFSLKFQIKKKKVMPPSIIRKDKWTEKREGFSAINRPGSWILRIWIKNMLNRRNNACILLRSKVETRWRIGLHEEKAGCVMLNISEATLFLFSMLKLSWVGWLPSNTSKLYFSEQILGNWT